MRCLIMNGIERQVAAHVGPVVDQVPHHERFLGQFLVLQELRGAGRQLQGGDVRGGPQDPAEPGSLAVREDGAPGEGGRFADGHGLREQHGGVGVVAAA